MGADGVVRHTEGSLPALGSIDEPEMRRCDQEQGQHDKVLIVDDVIRRREASKFDILTLLNSFPGNKRNRS